MNDAAGSRPDHRPLVRRLLLVVLLSLVFSLAMVPFYDVLCQITGLNGKTPQFAAGGLAAAGTAPPARVDTSRSITVEFTGTVMPGLPWEMQPLTSQVDVHPGELQQVRYRVRNLSPRRIVAQAIPSISPGQAARHFEKLECFCFTRQALEPGETAELPLMFIVKPEVDADVRSITLSYAFFQQDGEAAASGGKPPATIGAAPP